MRRDTVILVLLGLCALSRQGFGCGPEGKSNKRSPPPPTAAPNEAEPVTEPDFANPANQKSNVDSGQPKNPSNPNGAPKGEPGVAERPEDLSCSASDEKCCWVNEDLMKSGPFFYAGESGDGSLPVQVAWLKSCAIPCMDPGATVSLSNVLAYKDVTLYACIIGSGSSGPPERCGQIMVSNGKGKGTLDLEYPRSDVQIIIEAEGFSQSGLAAIDGISVEYTGEQCPEEGFTEESTTEVSTTTMGESSTTPMEEYETEGPSDTEEETYTAEETPPPRPPTTTANGRDIIADADALNCASLKCDKQDCMNFPAPEKLVGFSRTQRNDWKTHFPGDTDPGTKSMHNIMTGVEHDNRDYRGVYLLSGRGSVQPSSGLNVLEDRILQFEVFERTNGIVLKVCTDMRLSNCPFATRSRTLVSKTIWEKGAIRVPKGTEQVYFVAENGGRNQGGVGIRNMKWFSPADPNDPTSTVTAQNVCKGAEQRRKIMAAIRQAKIGRAKAQRAASRKGRKGKN